MKFQEASIVMSNGQWNVSVFSKLWFVFSSLIPSVIVVNSWGGLSHDLAKGNFFDFGTFSPCFQIERNATHHYDTQYCIAQLKFRATEVPRRTKAAPWFVYMWKKFNSIYMTVFEKLTGWKLSCHKFRWECVCQRYAQPINWRPLGMKPFIQ